MQASKQRLRAELAERRAALSPQGRADAAALALQRLERLPIYQQARSCFVYVSIEPELDTHALIDALALRGCRVLVPKITTKTTMNAVRFPGWEQMQAGPLGILAPRANEAYTHPIDLALVPGLGFTRRGDRVGYGSGYYDRWLAAHPNTYRIALAYDCQLASSIASKPHDQVMDTVVTEHATIYTKVRSSERR